MTWRRVLVPALVLLALTGCYARSGSGAVTPVSVTEAEMAGVWTDSRRGGMLILNADQSFTATNLPYEMFRGFEDHLPPGFDQKRDTLPAAGRWAVRPPFSPGGVQNTVALRLDTLADRVDKGAFNIGAQTVNGELVLVFYVDDPDLNNRIVYHRCTTCASTAPIGTPADPADAIRSSPVTR